MATNISISKPLDGSSFSGSLISPTNSRDRRDSINSVSVSSTFEKEQMAQALDQIHTAASRTDSLTLFNESFAPPPVIVPDTESRGTVQQGLSGLYSRLRVAVGAASSSKAAQREDDTEKLENLSRKASTGEGHRSKPSISSLNRAETGATISSTSSQPAPPDVSSPTTSIGPADGRPQMPATSKSGSISLIGSSKSHPSSRQSLPTNATSDVTAAEPTITSARKREPSRSSAHTEDSAAQSSRRGSTGRPGFQTRLSPVDSPEGSIPSGSQGDESVSSVGGASGDAPLSPVKGKAPLMSPLQTLHSRSPSAASSLLSPDDIRRKPAVIDRISHSNHVRYASRDSSIDRGTAEASPISTNAHNSVHHNSFSQESNPQRSRSGDVRIPGTTASHQGASDQMNAQLDRMRRQILSKEFWMKDETVKECFLCQSQFTAFRRKHHCRTCGFIFDSKCTIVIPGDKFGLPGSLRVCKRCLDVITRRFDASASEDSGDEQSFLPRIFGTEDPRKSTVAFAQHQHHKEPEVIEGSETSRPVTTPMMTIQAARRVKESNPNSSVLEIGAPQLSRPSSSRSLKSLSSGRPQSSAGHKRHHSKHGLLGRIKPDQAPFRKGIQEENARRTKFPAFHDDNIIDPELADFMSDDSSGDEQQVGSIFATLASAEIPSTSFDPDKSNLSALMNTSKKQQHHRHRGGEKSVSGMSHFSRSGFGLDELAPGFSSHRRTNRRRNLSNVSGSVHHFGSPRPKSVYKGPSASSELLFPVDNSIHPNHSGTQLTRSNSLQKRKAAKTKLNESSLKHVDKLLYQLLRDADIPNPGAWQKALVPILLQATDDVSPDVANGESMDIRTYVKLKRIPGGKPGDTSYISGIVFTKNLALKSMPRKITNPRILLVGFPIEYQRHQQQFMSLEPVIAQEKEFLRIVVNRIAQLKPQVLLAEKTISGLALQYLSEANISVAFNVKRSVIAAVARCTETKIIESLDMLEAQVGRCSAFEVRTFVNNDYPGRKKSYIFLSGCRPELGCTITLRGASDALLAKMKYITDFMVYVVYNLKLESSLLRDESVEPPEANDSTSMSNSFQALNESIRSLNSVGHTTNTGGRTGPIVVVNQPSSESEPPSQLTMDSSSFGGTDEALSQPPLDQMLSEPPRLLSLHESHTHDSTFSQVPDDVPMPTFYSDMVAKYETKILSVSPYVRFTQPYLLMKAREQERRLFYLKRLRDQDMIEEDLEKSGPPKFQLIKPEMVEELGQKAPRQIMEILHAVHDAEYDKALYNYQTQTRQWETYIQGNLDLFDPYSHQNIIILYSVICTETKIPCTEPSLVGINFYDEQREDSSMDPDCTLGQYIEYLVNSKDDICDSNGCDRKMAQHHRTFVHDQFRITVFVEHLPNAPPRSPELGDGISMWSYCKICQKDSEEIAMSETTFKYSFGKYLELLYWGRGLRMKDAMECPHDHQKDHVRYFSLNDSRVRIHWDPIDLLEIVVPRARLTWKVSNDLRLKNDIFGKMDERWAKFMASVIARLESIRIDSVLPEKAESCKAELDRLKQKAKEEEAFMIQRLQEIYVNSKYYEVVPFNIIVREMLETASEWDQVFATFEADFLGDKDMRQLTMLQLKKIFTDNESKESLGSNEGTGSAGDSEERPSQTFSEAEEKSTQPTDFTDNSMEASATSSKLAGEKIDVEGDGPLQTITQDAMEQVQPLDLASTAPVVIQDSQAVTGNEDAKTAPAATTPPDAVPVSQSPPVRMARSPTNSSISGRSLSERIDASALKKSAQPRPSQDSNERPADMETPRQVSEQGVRRKSTTSTSPPVTRAASQPSRTLARLQSLGKSSGSSDSVAKVPDNSDQQSEISTKSEKKLSERLGLNVLKNRGKMAGSSIPRLVPKKKESKVTTLAKHFEQLSREFSREFEKERIRDRKKRAASMRNPRPMLPKTSTQAIVQVYDNVNEAFDEPAVTSEQSTEKDMESQSQSQDTSSVPLGGKREELPKPGSQTEPPTPSEPPLPSDGQVRWDDDSANVNTSQGLSDDEGGTSDAEPSVSDEFMPDIKEMADSNAEIPLELPKHEKMSLMKYLTNFWAERSASGWPALEYPVNATDHIFVDSDIIVREDEPSSVIALALNSDDYKEKLANIRRDAHQTMLRETDIPDEIADDNVESNVDGNFDGDIEGDFNIGPKSAPVSDSADWAADETELEKSLLRSTGTHLKYQFKEGAAVMTCKIFYAEQFDALRRKCGVSERIVESLSRCLQWDSKGGKTKSVFLKTLDDRLVLKSLSTIETSAFLRFAPGYFSIMAEALFHDLPSVIAKMMGFFQVVIKNPVTGTDIKLDLLVTENLFYDRSPTRIFDLKGSMRNRKINATGEQNEVLLDENMVEYIYESPLFAREHSKKLLRASVWNDTLFLARQNVMDYSLMIAVDERRKELVVGIIDCIRTYTWDKKLESWIKDRGFAGGGRNRPTVTSPKEYKSRFREAMARYILQAPNCWHLFNKPQYNMLYGRARFEEEA